MRSNQDIHNQVILYWLVKEAIFVDEMRWKERFYTIDSNGNKKRYEPNSILSED